MTLKERQDYAAQLGVRVGQVRLYDELAANRKWEIRQLFGCSYMEHFVYAVSRRGTVLGSRVRLANE